MRRLCVCNREQLASYPSRRPRRDLAEIPDLGAAALVMARSGGFFVRMSIWPMSTNFGEGTPAGFHACSQVFLKCDFGFTQTFPQAGGFTRCTAFF
jgi:hypothetical protein